MFYLTVLLPSILLLLSYYILIFLRVKDKCRVIKEAISFSLFGVSILIVIVAVKIAVKTFSIGDFWAILLLYLATLVALISIFLEVKIFTDKKESVSIKTSVDALKIQRLTEVVKGALNGEDTGKQKDVLSTNNFENGLLLDHRTTQNATVNEIDITALDELFARASNAKNAYKHKKLIGSAKKMIDDLKGKKDVKITEVESLVNGLIKILSNENFEI